MNDMSYDIAVFEQNVAPRTREEFINWFDNQTEWNEEHSYDDPVVSSSNLRAWFLEIILTFPTINGPYKSKIVESPQHTDYSIGNHIIYCSFGWAVGVQAVTTVLKLAQKHNVGIYEVSAQNGFILFPTEELEL